MDSGNDPDCARRAGMDCDRPHRHAARHELLALLVQEAFERDPHGGDLYVFRGKSGQLVSLYLPLSDSRQADHPIVLIINVVFRPAFNHALHRYAYCF
jgi:hypothetical protein